MLTKLDTTRLVPRQPHQPQANQPQDHAHDGPVFTLSELIDTLEDRPEIREVFRQALLNRRNSMKKERKPK